MQTVLVKSVGRTSPLGQLGQWKGIGAVLLKKVPAFITVCVLLRAVSFCKDQQDLKDSLCYLQLNQCRDSPWFNSVPHNM